MTSSSGLPVRFPAAGLRSFLLPLVLVSLFAGCGKHGGEDTQAEVGTAGVSRPHNAGSSADTGTGTGTSGGTSTASDRTSANVPPASAGQVGNGMAAAAREVIDDSVITTRLKTALLADASLEGAHISVDTRHGEVVMTGTVLGQAQKEHAAHIAQALNGVKAVNNKLALAK